MRRTRPVFESRQLSDLLRCLSSARLRWRRRSRPSFKVVASGLDNPRHLTFSATGDLYVAEAAGGFGALCRSP